MSDRDAWQQRKRYCGGLPKRGTRQLAPHEAMAVRRRYRRLQLELGGGAVAFVGAGVVGWWGATHPLAAEFHPVAAFGLLWLTAIGAIGVGVSLLSQSRIWRIPAGIGLSYAFVFAAAVGLGAEPGPSWLAATRVVIAATLGLGATRVAVGTWVRARLIPRLRALRIDVRRGLVDWFGELDPSDPKRAARLEVLPRSGLVLRINSRPCQGWPLASVISVAATVPHAMRIALPDGVVPRGDQDSLQFQRRSLSPAERDELAAHCRHLRRRVWPVVVATAGVAGVASWRLWTGLGIEALIDWVAIASYVALVAVYVDYVRRVLAARKLEWDADLRWVVTVVDRRAVDPDRPPKLEVLAVSQLAWTENARPALWRLSRL